MSLEITSAFEQFKPTLDKLHQDGFDSSCKDWWRSRWYDWLNYKGDDPDWKRKNSLEKLFPQVWETYKKEFTTMPNKQPTNEKLDYALLYATEWKWKVFPCEPKDKKPMGNLVPHGFKDATAEADQISIWWKVAPKANIGLATGKESNLVVVDFDTAKGADVNAFLKKYNLDATIFSQTPKAKTGGGIHLYFKYPANAVIKNSASKLGDFIDVRGDGGYVIAPGSVHSTGAKYEWLNNAESLLDFPQVLIDALEKPSQNGTQPDNPFYVPEAKPQLVVPSEIGQGQRNQEMAKIAGKLRSIGFSEKAIYEALAAENHLICKPPLDRSEIEQIARSIARYTPNEVLKKISEGDEEEEAKDYENTLKPFQLFDLLNMQFEEKEIIAFHLGKKDVGIIQAGTNAGKTTLLRNGSLCMAAGRAFPPFFDGKRPIKLCYFDFENDPQDVQRDLVEMIDVFTPEEKANLAKNFIVLPKGIIAGELFQFNRNEKYTFDLLHRNKIEYAIVDNVSAAYDLKDENSNSEVTQKIIKPLLKMAYKADCAFLFAHHYGKGKNEVEKAGVHAGRGASALQSLARVVFNMFGDVSKGEISTVECAKRKTDGGQNYRESFKLEDRWFVRRELVVPAAKPKSLHDQIKAFVNTFEYPKTVKTKDVLAKFENHSGVSTIKKALEELAKWELIDKPKFGHFCRIQDEDEESETDAPKVRNYYEKDND